MNSSYTKSPSGVPAKSLPLFGENSDNEWPAGTLNDDALVRGVITDAIKKCGKSRDQIAEEMQELLAIKVTARMITCFTTESKELHRWPGAWDRAFCIATRDQRLLRCRVELAGFKVISKDEAELLELGRQFLIHKRSEQSMNLLERQLVGVEL